MAINGLIYVITVCSVARWWMVGLSIVIFPFFLAIGVLFLSLMVRGSVDWMVGDVCRISIRISIFVLHSTAHCNIYSDPQVVN